MTENRDFAAEAQHELLKVTKASDRTKEFETNTHPDAAWFKNAGLGLFIHWGISSVHGGLDISWSMLKNTPWDKMYNGKNKVTPNEYFALADRFNPDNYSPDKWIKAAAATGFRYAVLTTRHHDGYALWPSRFGEFSTRTHMEGRNLVKPYVDACRKYGLKVGLYYSPPDWYFNREYMSFDYYSPDPSPEDDNSCWEGCGPDHEPAMIKPISEEHEENYRKYINGQVKELLTDYGKVDILWFDGGPDAISFEEIHALQPAIIVNNRMHGYGDFVTPESELPEKRPAALWEACMVWNYHSWGYQKPHGYKPTGWMLGILVQCASMGGNLLINCALKPDGSMPDSYYERMSELKAWMEYGKESVIGVEPGPFAEQYNVPVTARGNIRYLHLLPKEKDVDHEMETNGNRWHMHLVDSKLQAMEYALESKHAEIRGVEKPKSVKLLRTKEEIPYSYDSGTVKLTLETDKCTFLDDVVEIVL